MTRTIAHDLPQNRLLSRLRPADLKRLRPLLQTVKLRLPMIVVASGKPVRYVYFPTSGVLSMVAAGPSKRQIEVAVIGREGLTAVNVLLGQMCSPHTTLVRIAGQAERIKVEDLQKALRRSASLKDDLLRFVQTLKVQAASAVLAVADATLLQRLTRWLLMAHDRLDGNDLFLTHVHLALILGCQRTGVTGAMNELKAERLIDAKRGIITIRDRAGLEAVANGFYGVPEAEYRRVIERPAPIR